MSKRDDKDFEDLQRTLLRLHDELTENFGWTALLCDGLCGLMVDETANVDSSSLLKKAILAFFNSLRRGACPRLAPKIKHLRVGFSCDASLRRLTVRFSTNC